MKRNVILLTLLAVLFLPVSLSQNLPAETNQVMYDTECKMQDNRESCILNHASQGNPQLEKPCSISIPHSEIQNPKLDKAEFVQKTMKLQMPFIANNGQMGEQVIFYAKTFGGMVFVTKEGEIVYSLPKSENPEDGGKNRKFKIQDSKFKMQDPQSEFRNPHCEADPKSAIVRLSTHDEVQNPKSALKGIALKETLIGVDSPLKRGEKVVCNKTPNPNNKNETHPRHPLLEGRSGVALKEEFVGAKVKTIQGEGPSVTTVNYFTGNDPSKWKTDISTYDMVNLGEIYKGIELRLKAYRDNVEKLFCVKPGGSPDSIKIYLEGIEGLRVNKDGQLEADTEHGPVKFTKPVAYQEIDGKRVEVEVEYRIQESGDRKQKGKFKIQDSKFKMQNPNAETPNSEIQKLQSASSDLKNLKSEVQNRKSKIVKHKHTYGFTVASYDRTKDLIIDPLLASTYLGGSNNDYVNSLTLDTSGDVYVAGYTDSTDFPTTIGAYDISQTGSSYFFVSKLDGGLTSLLASTYLGGSDYDGGYSLALDTSGNVYVMGETDSSDFPTTSGAYDTSSNGVI